MTRREVLIECLELEREMWRISSKKYDTLEPMAGMEAAWEDYREKCRIIQEMIQALESETVRNALANWQMDIMAGKEPDMRF